MAEIVEDRVTGLHFAPGDARDLAAKVRSAAAHPEELHSMGANPRRAYEKKYTPQVNHQKLLAVYKAAVS